MISLRGRTSKTVLRIEAHKICVHFGKAPIRAGLWRHYTCPYVCPVSTFFEMIRDHSTLPMSSVGQNASEENDTRTFYEFSSGSGTSATLIPSFSRMIAFFAEDLLS